MKTLMIYGAAGYTGRMATEHAKAAGLDVIVAVAPAGSPKSDCRCMPSMVRFAYRRLGSARLIAVLGSAADTVTSASVLPALTESARPRIV